MLWDPSKDVDAPWRALIHRAADLIEKRGWCQHRTSDEEGRHCCLGALFEVGVDTRVRNTAILRIARGMSVLSIPHWNDTPGRTKEEVLAKLREVASAVGPE